MKAKKQCSGCAILVCHDEDTRNKILGIQHRVFDRIIECHEYRRGTKLKSYNQDLWKKRIFVKNIPNDYGNIQLKTIFEREFGKVQIASITKNKNGNIRPTNTGFITFTEENQTKQALMKKRIQLEGGHMIYIDKCISNKKNARAQRIGLNAVHSRQDESKRLKELSKPQFTQNQSHLLSNISVAQNTGNSLLGNLQNNGVADSGAINQRANTKKGLKFEDSESDPEELEDHVERLRNITKLHLINRINANHIKPDNLDFKKAPPPMNYFRNLPIFTQPVQRRLNTNVHWRAPIGQINHQNFNRGFSNNPMLRSTAWKKNPNQLKQMN